MGHRSPSHAHPPPSRRVIRAWSVPLRGMTTNEMWVMDSAERGNEEKGKRRHTQENRSGLADTRLLKSSIQASPPTFRLLS